MSAKVLVVDDSTMIRNQVARALVGAGFTVVTASDGMDAMEKIAAETDVSLVVSDVNMPRMGGIELLEELRVGKSNNVPFVLLTTEDQVELVARAKALGAGGWFVKPLKPELLVSTARKLTGT